MKSEEKIHKAVHTAFEAAKDKAQTDVYNAVVSKKVKLEKDDLQKVMAIVASAVDSVYSGSQKSLRKAVSDALEEASVATASKKEAPKRTSSKSTGK